MPFRVSYFYKQQADLLNGYSLNLWNNNADLSAAQAAAEDLVGPILGMIGAQAQMNTIRISDVDRFRSVVKVRYGDRPPLPPSNDTDSDYPDTAALLKLEAAGGYTTFCWLRGLRDASFNQGGQWHPTAEQTKLLKNFFAKLSSTSAGWVLKRQDKGQPKADISAVTTAGVVTAPAHPFVTGNKVRISRARGTFVGLNKVWKVTKIDADTFQLNGFVVQAGAVYSGNGTAQKQVVVYLPISKASIERATSHRCGRPFGLRSGRRKRRAS